MLAGIAVTDEFLCPRVEILLADLDALPERSCRGLVEDLDASSWPGRHLETIQAGAGLRRSHACGPDLSGRKRIGLDRFVAMQLRSRNKLLYAIHSKGVAEVGVSELTLEAALLLFLDAAPGLQRQANDQLQILVGHRHFRFWEKQLHQSADRLVHRFDIAATQSTAQEDATLHDIDAAAGAKLAPAFRKEVAYQTKVVCQVRGAQLREIPSRRKRVQTIHEGSVVPHLRRQRAQQMADALLLLDVNIEIADHHDPAVCPDILFAAAELAGGHVALHNIDAVLLIEGDAGDLVKADDIVLAHQATLSRSVVHKHLGD